MSAIVIPDKRTVAIPKGGAAGPFYTQTFVDPEDANQVKQTEFQCGWDGYITVHLQGRIKMAETGWPTWLEIQTVREGEIEDPTGAETLVVPVKRSWAFNYTLEMRNDLAKPLSIQIRHNGDAPVQRVKGILKILPRVIAVESK